MFGRPATTLSGPWLSGRSGISTPHASAAAVAHRYFTLYNTILQTGEVAPLAALFARNATLTEHASLTTAGQPLSTETIHGLPAIRAALRAQSRITPPLHWTLDSMTRISTTMVIYYAHTASTPARRISLRSWQRFVIRGGVIVSLETSLYSVPR
jgi:hypothetical protein